MRLLLAGRVALSVGFAATPALAQTAASLPAPQQRAILQHGPWPPPWVADPSNPVSGDENAAALGRLLFFDARLSPSGRVACSSCHRPERGWSDGRPKGKGVGTSRHNTPTLLDVRLNRRFGWTGAGDNLWRQSIRPILDPVEMGSSASHVRDHLSRNQSLAILYRKVFGDDPGATDEQEILRKAGMALAAYQETITSRRTPFDDLRDALAAGDDAGVKRYPERAMRGLVLFVGAAGCAACHSGPAFSDGSLHNIGSTAKGQTRHQAYRTPTLRGLLLTGPYLHHGARSTLAGAIRAHLASPRLDRRQIADLLAFLATLSPPGRR